MVDPITNQDNELTNTKSWPITLESACRLHMGRLEVVCFKTGFSDSKWLLFEAAGMNMEFTQQQVIHAVQQRAFQVWVVKHLAGTNSSANTWF